MPDNTFDTLTPLRIKRAGDALLDLANRLEHLPPHQAAELMAPVLDPDGGVLNRLSHLLAIASQYAHRCTAPRDHTDRQVWADLGRAANDLWDWSQALDTAAEALGHLHAPHTPTAGTAPSSRPAHMSATPRPTCPPSTTTSEPGRRR